MILLRGRSDEQGIKLSWAELQAGAGWWSEVVSAEDWKLRKEKISPTVYVGLEIVLGCLFIMEPQQPQ